jgi:N-acetylglucosamine kinase-like BadF-type ATPase
MTVVLGVDGGGTKTHAVVADEQGSLLGSALAGPSNWEVVGIGGTGAALRVAVMEALEAAGVAPEAVEASVFGLAGVDWPSDLERLRFAIEPLGLRGPRELVNDSFVALRAGASRPWGVVVIAGTGAVAAGRNRAGEVFRTLGLGAVYGDFGSANDVSVEAVRVVADAYTGRGPSTALGELLCRHLGLGTVAEVLERLSRREHGGRIEDDLEGLAPVVIEAANGGDLIARDILERAGAGLGASAVLVARTLRMLDTDLEIVLAGALITGASRFVSDPFEVAVRREAPSCRFVHLHAPPAVGAALMALEFLGRSPGEDARGRLSAAAACALWGAGGP